MFTFQSIMFVSLGFLCALLLGFVVAPAFWARAVRLTTERLRASLPLSEQEISAERDRLRAENAIRVHQLTAKIEQSRLHDARQKVEINRRDGTISALQRRLRAIETEREGSENARRVLEATITQRVPEIEARLMEARQLLAQRDAEMKALQSDTGRTFRALDDAMQVNAQQRAEIDQLKTSLAGRQGARGGDGDAVRRGAKAGAARQRKASIVALPTSSGDGGDGWDPPIQDAAANGAAGEAEVAKLQAKIAEQSAKIESLSGQLSTLEESAAGKGRSLSLRDTKSALKARIAASTKELAARDELIEDLRRELATANERTARQASYYQDELRRLGAGGAQTSSSSRASSATTGEADDAAGAADEKERGAGDVAIAEPAPETKEAPAAAANGDGKAKLEERLAGSAETADDETALDFDQHVEVVEPERAPPRGKLMDRIADLAKR